MIECRTLLMEWYQANKRPLPWRESKNPYFIWLSEIILQQTRVEQGTPYFLRFKKHFPEISVLAYAPEDEVLKLWQGLGYYSRARNLHYAAQQVMNEFGGKFPSNYQQIIKLKGVGPYTAAAISSIAFSEAKAAVDGNVTRVISRLFGIIEPVNTGSRPKEIQLLADELLDRNAPGDFNQAIMEFGAIQCTPKKPSCESCPISSFCVAHKSGIVNNIPLKEKKIIRRSRFLHYLILSDGNDVLIQQRTGKDIWQGLFEFPMIETDEDEELNLKQLDDFVKKDLIIEKINKEKKHILSHQDLWARFYHIKTELKNLEIYQRVSIQELHTFALPRLIDRYLEFNVLNDEKNEH